ncbi:sodium:proton antiporter [Arthrobacter agilis]|uniref:cation:proton antiporter n=1 Tax=Arthrobacter agilis TaxID=37921 RepID=UPI000B34FD25|nr:cation:proton antiporter [Arthrobacter agilis]OUM40698.1 cation transporter [Arthrobacter agilis]PPB45307.1 cation transporter [Arthrobacter agilis]TPV28016.1 sodium:proton antiporter [Arthrobacter agilis]WDF33892.1 cation:proton antiporter [Arthrobacter agilis]VDR31292.1 potassium/proton antiporter [Arthrobacter agilis]
MFEPESIIYAAAGLAVFAAALLPRLLMRAPVSMPMVFFGAGILIFSFAPDLPDPDPIAYSDVTIHLSEVCVIISLMGAGLALDRRLGWKRWSTTWRLLGIAMPLCILGLTLMGMWVLGLGVASALLIAAALAPTDPVLASEVQVGEPSESEEDLESEDEVRFGLTSEAGLNDGLAFPFVYLAILLSTVGLAPSAWFPEWILLDVLWRMTIGCAFGFGMGKLLGRIFFRTPLRSVRLANYSEGFVALAATFLTYGVTEAVEGYGFIAVFVCALTIRSGEQTHGYHGVLHSYIEQLERLLTIVVLVLLGGAVARGLFEGLRPLEVVVAVAFILLVRPVFAWLSLARTRTGPRERGVIAFFGVRGIGSVYYLSYALSKGEFAADAATLWRIGALVIVMSIVIHGITAAPVINALDRARQRKARDDGDEALASVTPV